jgi:predicted AAA+ superfamily ATPase
MLIERHIKARLFELLQDFRIVYLTGPRQAGKSTLAREIAAFCRKALLLTNDSHFSAISSVTVEGC